MPGARHRAIFFAMTTLTAATAFSTPVPSDAVDALRSTVAGPVHVPGDALYDSEISPWIANTVHSPDVVVGATCAEDVAAAVQFALQHGLSVSVQATGHGATTAIHGGVLISTRRMTAVAVDAERGVAQIAAGAKWAAVLAASTPHGLAPLSGSTTDVGAIGYSLGGGLGPLGRKYGFAADQIRSAQIVTGDGQLRTVSGNDELIGALRGGKGNFGIVTSLEVGLVPVARLYGGAMFFDGADAATVLHAWREWVETVPEDMTSSIALLRLPDLDIFPPPLRGQTSVHLRIAYDGDAAEGERLVAPLRAVATPVLDMVRDMPFTEVDSIHMDPLEATGAHESGRLLTALPAEAVDTLLAAAGPDVDVPIIFAEIRHMGGALARQPEFASSVAGRNAAFSLFVLGPMAPGLEEIVPPVVAGVVQALAPWHAQERLINFIGHDMDPESVTAAYPAEVAARLTELKHRYDPAGLFSHGPALPSSVIPRQYASVD
ncbi:MAG: hypothetical protein QOE05_205 [Actinomycetota bacterium]|jgi:FAD/FMN-containing dehydrogenase|nr:hypothetical protein [Actinomycetota bacterium]